MGAEFLGSYMGLNRRSESTYTCQGCGRDVDVDLEVCPAEPDLCIDCWEAAQ